MGSLAGMLFRVTTAVVFGALCLVFAVGIRYQAAGHGNYGPTDVDRFKSQLYSSEIDRDTHPFFLTWIRGDGQAFFILASDPDINDDAQNIGLISYRYTRIGISLAARAIAFGERDRLPEALAAVSLTSYGLLGFVAMRLRERLGSRALLLAITPAPILAAVFDTAESAGALLLVLGITTQSRRAALLWSGLLGLTRPSYGTALPAANGGYSATIVAAIVAIAIQAFVVVGLDAQFAGGASNLGLPLVGLIGSWQSMSNAVRIVSIAVMSMTAALIAIVAQPQYKPGFRMACGLTAGLVLSFGPPLFLGPLSLVRATGALPILLILAPLYAQHGGTADQAKQRAVPQRDSHTNGIDG